jgi:hypothetical protein
MDVKSEGTIHCQSSITPKSYVMPKQKSTRSDKRTKLARKQWKLQSGMEAASVAIHSQNPRRINSYSSQALTIHPMKAREQN